MLNNIHFPSKEISNCANAISLKQQHDALANDYIEIPSNIKNFTQLQEDKIFFSIKSQYIGYINKLPELYHHFTGLKNNNLDLIINQIRGANKPHLEEEILFYSYKIIREQVYNITTYLAECKERHISNNKTAIICAQLAECFGVCFEGFNSKILRIGSYISSYNDIDERINFKIKCFIEELIDSLLIKYSGIINIHEKNALFNMAATFFNFDFIQDKYANLSNFDDYSVDNLIGEFNIRLSGFNICKIIARELYILFKDIIIKNGKERWLDNYIDDITAEFTFYLEDHFINLVNQYLNIELEEDRLSIHSLMSLTEENRVYITDVKDKLHLLCAKYIHKILNFSRFSGCENKKIISSNKTAIFSVNNRYFYVVECNKITAPIQLNHLELINPYKMGIEVYVCIFIQALEQTFSTKYIYDFFNNNDNYALLFFSYHGCFLCQELNRLLKQNSDVKNRVLSAMLHIHSKNNITSSKICKKLISNNIIADELLQHLFINNVDISPYLIKASKKHILSFVISLGVKSIEKIFINSHLYNPAFIKTLRYMIFYLFVEKKWELITDLLKSKIKFHFLESLTDAQKKKALVIVLSDRKYNIAEYFLLNYIQLNITDYNKRNIIHHVILDNNLTALKDIVKKTRGDILHKLLLGKNNEGLTPLTMAMLLSNSIDYFDILLSCCNDAILSVTHNGINAIMLAAQEGCNQCLKKLITQTTKRCLLTNSNKYGYNSLMLAIKSRNDDGARIILNNIEAANLRSTEKIYGYTAIHLAIVYRSNIIENLVNKADKETLKVFSSSLSSVLSVAAQENNENAIEIILKKCNEPMLYKKNLRGLNPLMIAASNGYLGCLKKLFKYSDKSMLTKKNNKGNNILMLAIKNTHIECVNFILQNSPKDTLKKLYRQTNGFYYDALSMAQYASRKPVLFKGDYEETREKYKKILESLKKYKPQ